MARFVSNRKLLTGMSVLILLGAGVRGALCFADLPGTGSVPGNPIQELSSGPTMPPGPWDEKPVQVASGPTMPPGPWDEKPALLRKS